MVGARRGGQRNRRDRQQEPDRRIVGPDHVHEGDQVRVDLTVGIVVEAVIFGAELAGDRARANGIDVPIPGVGPCLGQPQCEYEDATGLEHAPDCAQGLIPRREEFCFRGEALGLDIRPERVIDAVARPPDFARWRGHAERPGQPLPEQGDGIEVADPGGEDAVVELLPQRLGEVQRRRFAVDPVIASCGQGAADVLGEARAEGRHRVVLADGEFRRPQLVNLKRVPLPDGGTPERLRRQLFVGMAHGQRVPDGPANFKPASGAPSINAPAWAPSAA